MPAKPSLGIITGLNYGAERSEPVSPVTSTFRICAYSDQTPLPFFEDLVYYALQSFLRLVSLLEGTTRSVGTRTLNKEYSCTSHIDCWSRAFLRSLPFYVPSSPVISFLSVAFSHKHLTWQPQRLFPNRDVVMNCTAFQEALRCTEFEQPQCRGPLR